MTSKNIIYLILFFVPVTHVMAQSQVSFHKDFDKALRIAKLEGKDVFVDTWASWCIPCKKQKKVFNNTKVRKYLNEHFVNVQINMDDPIGKRINLEYEVVFLPTLIVLNSKGEVKLKTENFLNIENLLDFLSRSKSKKGKKYISTLNNKPFKEKEVEKVNIILAKDKVITVIDNVEIIDSTLNVDSTQIEEFLFIENEENITDFASYYYNKTFLEMQNMDDGYKDSFEKYLSTQSDWSFEKNMLFIYNFTSKINSLSFQFMIDNREDFEQLVGADKYEKSIQFLIYNRLYQGFPRANMEDANRLFNYLYSEKESEKYAMQFYLQGLLSDGAFQTYVEFGEKHLSTQIDLEVMFKMSEVYLFDLCDAKNSLKTINRAIRIDPDNHTFHHRKAEIYLFKDKRKKALKSALKAKKIANIKGLPYLEWESLLNEINGAVYYPTLNP